MTAGYVIPWYTARRIADPKQWGPGEQALSDLVEHVDTMCSTSLTTSKIVMDNGLTVPALIVCTPFSRPPESLVLAVEHVAMQHGLTDEIMLPPDVELALFNYCRGRARETTPGTTSKKHLHGAPVNVFGQVITTERSN